MQNARPWEVPLEEYKALESTIKPTTKLIKIAEKLTEKLNNGTRYGHVAAYLYADWTMNRSREAVSAHWAEYAKWQTSLFEKQKSETRDIDDLFA